MSVADQINRIKTNIANTYTAAQAKGATMPQAQNSDNLAACIQSITTGGGGGTQFGLTAEQMLGTLDGEGNLTMPKLPSITFTGLKSISRDDFYYKFAFRSFETGSVVSFPDLTIVSDSGMDSCFFSCYSLTSIDLSSLISIGVSGMDSCFNGCTSLSNGDFSALTTVGSLGLNGAFQNTALTTISFLSLTTVGSGGLNGAFQNTALTTISFPSLTNVQTDSFGIGTYNYCFNGCTALTEIHFRADMQATIEALSGYADKWGATGATIYFSL